VATGESAVEEVLPEFAEAFAFDRFNEMQSPAAPPTASR
jgi:hypothetical protein